MSDVRKYELIYTDTKNPDGNQVLYRIKALIDIPMHQIKIGDLGGYIYGDAALSHYDSCWVADQAQVCDRARVSHHAIMRDNSAMFDDSRMYDHSTRRGGSTMRGHSVMHDHACAYGNSRMYDHSTMYDNACMYDSSNMFDDSRMYDRSSIHNDASMYGNSTMRDNSYMADDSTMRGRSVMRGNSFMYDRSCLHGDGELMDVAHLHASMQLHWKIDSSLMTINSSDGYIFAYNAQEDKISAGCRYFTYDEAVRHWTLTRSGTPLGEERLKIIKMLRAYYRPDLMGGEVSC